MIDPQLFATLNQNAHANLANQQRQQTAVQQKKSGNFLVNALPAIGGGLGAVAGIPLDIFGGAGSIAGGAGGASLGEALKEHLLGQSLSPKQIAIQGLEGGAGAAIPVGKIFQGAKGSAEALKGFVNPALQATANTAEKAAPTGLADAISNVGESLKGEARGIKPGVKVPGSANPLSTSGSKEVNQYLDTLGTKNSAHKQILAVEQDLQNNGNKISTLVQQNDRTVSPQEHMQIHAAGNDAAQKALGLDPNSQIIKNTQGQINGAQSLTDLQQVRSNIDNELQNFYKQTDRSTTTNADLRVLKGYRDGIDGVLKSSVPGFKEANTAYKTGLKARDLLYKNANPNGLRFFGVQTGVGGEGLQASKDLAGRVLQRASGKAPQEATAAVDQAVPRAIPTPDTTGAIPEQDLQAASQAAGQIPDTAQPTQSFGDQVTNALKGTATLPARAGLAPIAAPIKSSLAVTKQLVGRNIGNGAASSSQDNTAPGTPNTSLTDALSSALSSGQSQTPQDQSPYSQADLLSDIQRDPVHASQYISYYNGLGSIYNPTSATTVSKPSAQQSGLAGSAAQSLQQLASMIDEDPSIVAKNATPGQGLPGVGSLISNASGAAQYHSLADNVLSALIHLQTGATATKEEVTAAHGQLPQPGDSQQVIAQKLQTLASNFTPFLGTQ